MADIKVIQSGDLDPKSFTNDNSNNAGGIAVRLHPSEANLLVQTNQGLYYSFTADPESANLYVDAEAGDDNNAGTRAAPFKTIKEAFKKVKIGQPATIYLKEMQTHEVRSSEAASFANKSFSFNRYGEYCDSIQAARKPEFDDWAYYLTNLREVLNTNPTIKFICDSERVWGGRQVLQPFFFINLENTFGSRTLSFNYVNLDISNVRNGSSLPVITSAHGISSNAVPFTDSVTFLGCVFKLPKNDEDAFKLLKINGMAGSPTLFISCYFDTQEDADNNQHLLNRTGGYISTLTVERYGYVGNPGERFNAPFNSITNTDKPLVTFESAYRPIANSRDLTTNTAAVLML